MATSTESSRGGRSSSGRARGGSGISTETILDIVERLGVIDLVTARLRARLEEVDVDDLFDEMGDYVRRNPEVLVVALATITVSAGLIVYLNARRDDGRYFAGDDRDDEDEAPAPRASRPAARSAAAPRPRRSSS